MTILALDHINIRTARLDALVAWYEEVLGLKVGPRPDFPMGGAWLYAGDAPVVHLVETATPPDPPGDNLSLEHGAFRAEGLAEFLALLDGRGDRYRLSRVEDFGILQVNVWDPDGNHLHVDFALAEARGVSDP